MMDFMPRVSTDTLRAVPAAIVMLTLLTTAIILGERVHAQSLLSPVYTAGDAWDCAGGSSCPKPIGILDGKNRAFTLRAAPIGPAAVDVYLNGIRDRIGADYSLTGNTYQSLTFTSPPAADDTVDVRYRENVRANVLPQ